MEWVGKRVSRNGILMEDVHGLGGVLEAPAW